MSLLYFWSLIDLWKMFGGFVAILAMFTGFLSIALPSVFAIIGYRKAPYFSTDEAGLGITLWSGAIPVRWEDIIVARRLFGQLTIQALTPERIETMTLNLWRYRRFTQKELFRLIAERAGLSRLTNEWVDEVTQQVSIGRADTFALRRTGFGAWVCSPGKFIQLYPQLRDQALQGEMRLSAGPGDFTGQFTARWIMWLRKHVVRWRQKKQQRLNSAAQPDSLAAPSPDQVSTEDRSALQAPGQ
jgi:hypothetical protein